MEHQSSHPSVIGLLDFGLPATRRASHKADATSKQDELHYCPSQPRYRRGSGLAVPCLAVGPGLAFQRSAGALSPRFSGSVPPNTAVVQKQQSALLL